MGGVTLPREEKGSQHGGPEEELQVLPNAFIHGTDERGQTARQKIVKKVQRDAQKAGGYRGNDKAFFQKNPSILLNIHIFID